METWQRNLVVLWIGTLLTSASYSMVIPFLPLFLLKIGVHQHTDIWSGALYSAAFVAGAIAAPYWGSLGDRYGQKPMIVRAGFVLFVIYGLTAFVQHPWELLVLRTLQGLLSGYIPGSVALVGSNTPEDKVGYALSTISAASSAGGIVGPLVGGTIARLFGNRVAFGSASVLVLISTLLALFFVREMNKKRATSRPSVVRAIGGALHNKPLVTALSLNMVVSFSIMTIEPVLTLYIAELDPSASAKNASFLAGLVFSLAGIASVVFAPLWGKYADRIGFARVLTIGLAGGAVWTFMQIPFHSVIAFAAVRFVYGAFFCAVYPAINGLIVRSTDASFRGRAFGLNQTANQIGNTVGPLVGGAIADATSIHGVFWVTGALLASVTAGAYALMRHPSLLPRSEQTPHTPAP
ncbi:MFS transporter [Alicyclobacillus sendaiensis]|uniref:MFS transporter n=1 Tax=Alicyclobacillus sendaiensis PA2 TaxID=3029425 RepID=A0ABT6XY62_ALISE|nr:MFS transporter [Alicyclobacillus sendaiensis]MDI9260036.1 MFS transporter [Alicyclobacillus sendaiensis PA2]